MKTFFNYPFPLPYQVFIYLLGKAILTWVSCYLAGLLSNTAPQPFIFFWMAPALVSPSTPPAVRYFRYFEHLNGHLPKFLTFSSPMTFISILCDSVCGKMLRWYNYSGMSYLWNIKKNKLIETGERFVVSIGQGVGGGGIQQRQSKGTNVQF